ncbi:aspartate carbamoyltransferase, partial [Candidatus Woesearchaeota archaeon]|nr:aspartate carbamoyltransferase [Candidatus Woesearchaeota archaeon]
CDVMVVRNPEAGSVKELADSANVPVINAGDGPDEHPTQCLIDLYTIKKCQGKIDGLNIAMVGDLKFGRTVHSLTKALSNFNSKLFFVSPKELAMPDDIKSRAKEYEELEDVNSIMDKIDILYMTRIQKERFSDKNEYERLKGCYVLTADSLKKAKPNMRIMHPLPRVNEISEEIDKTEHAYYFQQAANAVPVRKAILGHVLGF